MYMCLIVSGVLISITVYTIRSLNDALVPIHYLYCNSGTETQKEPYEIDVLSK